MVIRRLHFKSVSLITFRFHEILLLARSDMSPVSSATFRRGAFKDTGILGGRCVPCSTNGIDEGHALPRTSKTTKTVTSTGKPTTAIRGSTLGNVRLRNKSEESYSSPIPTEQHRSGEPARISVESKSCMSVFRGATAWSTA